MLKFFRSFRKNKKAKSSSPAVKNGGQKKGANPQEVDMSKVGTISHGMGDNTPRTEKNADGSIIDNFVSSVIPGKTIPGTKSSAKVKAEGITYKDEDLVQDYAKIKAECLKNGKLFEDPEFPAQDSSLFFSSTEKKKFEWKRPHEICENPKFFVGGASRFDVKQGELGDCWLLAAIANLTLNPKIFHRIVLEDNSFEDGYAGIFHFRFWQYGRWVEVCVDDYLPTNNGQLVYMHSAEKNEFWSALLEKAFAKLVGSYEALKGGTTLEALEDFSGGVTELFDLKTAPENLLQIILKAFERGSFLACSIEPDPGVLEAKTSVGLIKGHAYSITSVKKLDVEAPNVDGKIVLIRIRNPWGNDAEWNGAWSDNSQEWTLLSEETKKDMGLTFDADGEFWMSYTDFIKYYDRLEICNLSPDSLEEEGAGKKTWNMSVFDGSWVRGCTAGGCRNYLETFACNPQYIINLEDPDEEDDEPQCTIIVALMQKNRRAQKKLGVNSLSLGFALYKVTEENETAPFSMEFFKFSASVARSPSFVNLREVCCRFKLDPGKYVIVPSTFEPQEEGDFLIRVFTEGKVTMKENDADIGIGKVDDRVEKNAVEESDSAKKVQEFFKSIAGEDMEVDWCELKQVLDLALKKEFTFGGFSKDVCRSMVAMMDTDRSGKLGLEEFTALWKSIMTWKNVFKLYDKDKSGTLSSFELREALTSAGYSVNRKVIEALALRFGDSKGQIMFDDFIMCAIKLKCMIETFVAKAQGGKSGATFTMEEWVETTLYS